ncbi:MAG: SsrA-binding protein [Mycoplasma sp.]
MHILFKNKKINFNYHIQERIEAGIELKGFEVKSLVVANATIDQAFIIFKQGECWIINMHIAPYNLATNVKVDPDRNRKLLLHKNEVIKLEQKIKKEHLACVPSIVYLKNNKIKVEICLCKSKNKSDKREDIKTRDAQREIKRYSN